jgi:putative methionine-R-sulfoxide reductase with GAF domain
MTDEKQFDSKLISKILELVEAANELECPEEMTQHMLPCVAELMSSDQVILYIVDTNISAPIFLQHGLQNEAVSGIEKFCIEQFENISCQTNPAPVTIACPDISGKSADLTLYPLQYNDSYTGLLGLVQNESTIIFSADLRDRMLQLIGNTISRLAERQKLDRQLMHLNTYLTISSMLSQSMGLHDLMDTVLSCSMDAVSAEAASVLLLDDEKQNFSFYQVEGPAKPALMTATLPVDKGLASSVLQTQQSEVINDVQNDPRFYRQIDLKSGFQTRNMIAIPLIAGEEPVGVLEVLNKIDGGLFTEDEHMLLLSIAEEIAFAIRNAKTFEYVASTYCKQRQGLGSCKGCKRPLGSWTPCIKQQEVSI